MHQHHLGLKGSGLLLGVGLFSAIFLTSSSQAHASADAARVAELQTQAQVLDLAHDIQWIKLVHYKKTLSGGFESQADGMSFFLSPNGKEDSASELRADIAAFFAPMPPSLGPKGDPKAQHAQCKFPARLIYLKDRLKFSSGELPKADCSRYLHFVNALGAKSATVVFSSYYLNNPSSAFGHSFIRLNRVLNPADGKNRELLDYGINYAAEVDTGNAILYAFKGTVGMFHGSFTSTPYYYKVREYNDSESRDLWEYDVHLEPKQVELMVAHLWELGSTYFDYYYFTSNCSYHVLSILEAANPALHLTDRTPYIVIPVDTIRVLNSEPGLVTSVRYRPSVRSQFQKRLEYLNPDETRVLQEVVYQHSMDRLGMLNSASQVKVLDAAADYIDFKYNSALLNGEGEPPQWKQQILIARSRIPQPSPDVDVQVPAKQMPQVSHPSRRVSLGQGWNQSFNNFTELQYRFALHDLTDPLPGFPSYAEIEMGKITTRYYEQRQKFEPEALTLFQIFSLTPLTTFDHQYSWHAVVQAERFYDRICNHCFGEDTEVGGGWAVGGHTLTGFLMGDIEGLAAPDFIGSHFRLGVGPSAGVKVTMTDTLLALFRTTYRYRFFDGPNTNYSGDLTLRWGISPQVSVFAHGLVYPTSMVATTEGTLGVSYYY